MSDVAVRDEVAPFQVMPPLSAEEYAALKADIAENGIEVAVEIDEDGTLIDGHHRVKAWTELLEAGVTVQDYPRIRVAGLTYEQKRDRARNLNLKRRHLSSEQKKEIAVELRREGKTQVEIAESLGVAHTTVGRWLAGIVHLHNTPLPEVITDATGRTRPTSYKPQKTVLAGASEKVEAPKVKSYAFQRVEAFRDERLTEGFEQHEFSEDNAVALGQVQYKCGPKTYAALWEHEREAARVRYSVPQLLHLIDLGEKGNPDETTERLVNDAESGAAKSVYDAHKLEQDARKMAHVGHNSGENEWYTPAEYIKAALATLGRIDLDPASSAKANETVDAVRFFTEQDDGLAKQWTGRVWMNPPYSASLIGKFMDKLCGHYEACDVTHAIVLVNNATETAWFQQVAQHASAICFPKRRVRFLDPLGNPGAPLQGQAVIYLGDDPEAFKANFQAFGFVL